ncbi:MAG: DUF4271 domain-containing protein [Sphingobacteriales bacterium]|nr:MAG: DUF4271 domain-containing protein [Sphingobacteriales bacterium]
MHALAKVFFLHSIYAMALFVLFFAPKVSAQGISRQDSYSSNNYIIAKTDSNSGVRAKKDSAVEHPSENFIPQIKQNIERYPPFYLYIFLGCAVLLAVVRLVSPSYLRELLLSTFNLKLLLNIFKEGRFDWNVNNFLLDVVFVLMLSIGIHQWLFAAQLKMFVWVLSFTAMAYFIKLILIQLTANIFFGRGEALVHLLMFTLFTRIAGLVLLIVLFAGLYQTVLPLPLLLQNLGYLLGIIYLIWAVRVYLKMKSISTGGMFYLFLYLCAIEVSPIIVLLKEVIV